MMLSAASISGRYAEVGVASRTAEMTAETLSKQNPRKRGNLHFFDCAQGCNTWVLSKVPARDGVGYPVDLYRRTVFHRHPATIRTHIRSRSVRRPSTRSTMPSSKDPRDCPRLMPVKRVLLHARRVMRKKILREAARISRSFLKREEEKRAARVSFK